MPAVRRKLHKDFRQALENSGLTITALAKIGEFVFKQNLSPLTKRVRCTPLIVGRYQTLAQAVDYTGPLFEETR